jgi:hypothetical protein
MIDARQCVQASPHLKLLMYAQVYHLLHITCTSDTNCGLRMITMHQPSLHTYMHKYHRTKHCACASGTQTESAVCTTKRKATKTAEAAAAKKKAKQEDAKAALSTLGDGIDWAAEAAAGTLDRYMLLSYHITGLLLTVQLLNCGHN